MADKIIRLADGRLAVLEYKTTSSELADDSKYWLRMGRNGRGRAGGKIWPIGSGCTNLCSQSTWLASTKFLRE